MSEAADDGVSKHTIPVIDRMMDVLCEIERKDRGLSISELTEALKLPRTTIYRILNSLQQHDIVYRDDTGSYHLGRRLLSLAAHVGVRATEFDLAALCQPFLDKLAAELGEAEHSRSGGHPGSRGRPRLTGVRPDGGAGAAHAHPCRCG